MKKSILALVPKNTGKLNTKAFDRGYAYALENLDSNQREKKNQSNLHPR